MKSTSIWSTHKVELQYQLIPIDPHCWIFVLEPMGSREISSQMYYYFGHAHGRVLPPWFYTIILQSIERQDRAEGE